MGVSPDSSNLSKGVERKDSPVIEANGRFQHIMALNFDPFNKRRGLVRGIKDREGPVDEEGFLDISKLYLARRDSPYEVKLDKELEIEGEEEIIENLSPEGYELKGLEDPDIWRDKDGTVHIYYTIFLLNEDKDDRLIYLGHAEGENLESLEMTEPVLTPKEGAKEVAIANENSNNERLNLVESGDTIDGTSYSVLRVARAEDMGERWELEEEPALHPAEVEYEWCSGHFSTGPFLPDQFVDIKEGYQIGFLNGRKPTENGQFGDFTVGLMVYNYEEGDIEWLSEKPIIEDPEADNITFASDFEQTNDSEGVLYTHVDDSWVQAYNIDSEAISEHIPEIYRV